jgi:hypothetical protein
VGRRSSLVRLGWAYARHQLRRRFRGPLPAHAQDVLNTYAEDRLQPLTLSERGQLPAISRCVNCGLCALVVKRVGGVRLADLPAAYLRDYTQLAAAATDLEGGDPGTHALLSAAAVCPVSVPLAEVAAAVRRLGAS